MPYTKRPVKYKHGKTTYGKWQSLQYYKTKCHDLRSQLKDVKKQIPRRRLKIKTRARKRSVERLRALEIVGGKCVICGKSDGIIHFHELNGRPHDHTHPEYHMEHKQDFIPLCYAHHRVIHALARLSPKQYLVLFGLVERLYHKF